MSDINIEERALESAEKRLDDMQYRLAVSEGHEKTVEKWKRRVEVAVFTKEAVKKQVSEGVKMSQCGVLHCPVCEHILGSYDEIILRYCPECGQRIVRN